MQTLRLAGPMMLMGLVSIVQAGAPPETLQTSAVPVKLLASDGEAGESFGQSVAISEGLALIGAPKDDDNGVLSGSAYAFRRDGDDWDQDDKLLAGDGVASDAFGWSVSLSGVTGMIGAIFGSDNGDRTGTAYAFTRGGNDWDEQDELAPYDGEDLDQFGHSVAVDGIYAVVGSIFGRDNQDPTGAVYAFKRSGSRWSHQDKLVPNNGDGGDQFGYAVALQGDTAVLGAPGDDSRGTSSGAAYVFVRNGSRWSQREKLVASDGGASDAFGSSVSISGDTIVVGAPSPNDTSSPGAAYVFVRDNNDWPEHSKLLAEDREPGDVFGTSVSISGYHIVVGAPWSDLAASGSGSAHLFVLTEDEWIERELLLPRPVAAQARFGSSVSVSGDSVLVGAPGARDNGPDSGAAFVFEVDYIFTLAVTLIGTGSGSVSITPPGIECEPDCSEDYTVETEVTLSADPDSDSLFVGWSGDADCDDGVVTMIEDLTCTAQFDLRTYELTVLKAGTGSGRVTSVPEGINCGVNCSASFDINTSVSLDPDPESDSVFEGWSGDPDCADGVVTMDADKSCTATFDIRTYTLTIVKEGSGSGTVISEPSGIDCGVDCSEAFPINTVVSLFPTADSNSDFEGWSGDPDCADGVVTMDADKTCIARFGSLLIFSDGFESGDTSSWSVEVP